MAQRHRWWNDFSRTWWIDKVFERLVVPIILIVTTGVVTYLVAPQILYIRDRKLAADAVRLALIEETAAENALLTNTAWHYEDALDSAFRQANRSQTARLREHASSMCKHTVDDTSLPAEIATLGDDWVSQVDHEYHEQFRSHQVWATRARLRLWSTFSDETTIQAFNDLEQTIGAYNKAIEKRRSNYDATLKKRHDQAQALFAEVRREPQRHVEIHDHVSLFASRAQEDKLIEQQRSLDTAKAEHALQQFIANLQQAPVAKAALWRHSQVAQR